MRNNKSKNINQTGITLVALIVTIIILIVIAGVGISMLTRRKWYT